MDASQYTLNLNQRWNLGRASYCGRGQTIRPQEYDVAEIYDDSTPRAFVCQHHYSGTYPAARHRVGLYRRGDLVGVAVFSHPCSNLVLTNVFATPATSAVELGRFVLLDAVPGNGETWFLARAFEVLRSHGLFGVVSFSDPLQRRTARGSIVHAGHVGTIYQAHNAVYLGRGTARTLNLLPDGRVLSDRAAQKIRAGERGWRYAAAQLESFGASTAPDDPCSRRAWLATSLRAICTQIRHRGNHKYAWPLTKDAQRQLPTSLPYPKSLDFA